MKKLILNKITLVLAIIIGFVGCEDDVTYSDNESRTFNTAPFVCIERINPLTGEVYTEEELAALSNPCGEETFYDISNPIELTWVSDTKPIKLDVEDKGTYSNYTTITDFTEEDGMYKATFTANFADIGIENLGDASAIFFSALYDLKEPTGEKVSVSTTFSARYSVFVDPDASTPYVFLKKSTGEVEDLATIGDSDITLIQDNIFVGKELAFNGSSDQIEISEVPELAFRDANDFSVGIWVKTTGDYNDPSIISDKNWGGGANPGFVLAYKGASGGVWKLNLGDGSNRVDIDGGSINDDNWHFIMATMDRDGDAIIYQDGVEVGRSNMSAITNMDSGNPIRIGQDGTGSYGDWFVGNTGEAYIFDYVVAPEEVVIISTQRTGVQLRKQDGTVKNIPVTATNTTATDEDGKFSFPLNGTDAFTTIDAGTEFDFTHTTDFSMSVWMKTTATNSDPVIIGNQNWSSGSNIGVTTAFTGGDWRVVTSDGPGNTRVNINGIGTINDGEWHLLTVSWDRDGLKKVYQDGLLIDSADISGVTETLDSGNPWRIGQDGTGAYGIWLQTSLANCIFFDYVLSDEEVLDLFTE